MFAVMSSTCIHLSLKNVLIQDKYRTTKLLKPGLNLNMQSQKDVQCVIQGYNDTHTVSFGKVDSERHRAHTQLKDEF